MQLFKYLGNNVDFQFQPFFSFKLRDSISTKIRYLKYNNYFPCIFSYILTYSNWRNIRKICFFLSPFHSENFQRQLKINEKWTGEFYSEPFYFCAFFFFYKCKPMKPGGFFIIIFTFQIVACTNQILFVLLNINWWVIK